MPYFVEIGKSFVGGRKDIVTLRPALLSRLGGVDLIEIICSPHNSTTNYWSRERKQSRL